MSVTEESVKRIVRTRFVPQILYPEPFVNGWRAQWVRIPGTFHPVHALAVGYCIGEKEGKDCESVFDIDSLPEDDKKKIKLIVEIDGTKTTVPFQDVEILGKD